jgi:hypothetical protein
MNSNKYFNATEVNNQCYIPIYIYIYTLYYLEYVYR